MTDDQWWQVYCAALNAYLTGSGDESTEWQHDPCEVAETCANHADAALGLAAKRRRLTVA